MNATRRVAMAVYHEYPSDPRVRREAEALASVGFIIDIVCLRGEGYAKYENYGNINTYRVLKYRHDKKNYFKYMILTSLFTFVALLKIVRLSAKFRYDLIQVHNMPDYLVFFGIFHKLFSRPLILDLHDLSPELFSSRWGKGFKGKILSPVVRIIEKISCFIADHLLTTSNGFYENLVSRGTKRQKITLVFNSANENIFKLTEPRKWEYLNNGVKIIYHGTIVKRFGLHIALEAVSKLRNEIPGIQLWLYGRYDSVYKDELVQMIRDLNLEGIVSLYDSLPWEGIVKKIEEADIGVVPYLSDEFMNLALSTKTFEYVAMNLPVVASKVDSIASIFDDDSISYFKPGDVDGLAKNISELCANPELRKKLVLNAAEQYKDYSWPVMSKRYTNLVSGLINNHK